MTSSSYGAAWCLKSVAVSFDGIQVSLRLQPSTRCRLSVTTFAEEDTPTFWQHFFILSHYFPFSLVSGALFSHFILSHCFLFLTGERRSLLPLLSGSLLSLLFLEWSGTSCLAHSFIHPPALCSRATVSISLTPGQARPPPWGPTVGVLPKNGGFLRIPGSLAHFHEVSPVKETEIDPVDTPPEP